MNEVLYVIPSGLRGSHSTAQFARLLFANSKVSLILNVHEISAPSFNLDFLTSLSFHIKN